MEAGKGREGRGGGAENTDGNYRNRNVEDEKSHTNKEQEKKITHSHVRKCTFTTKKERKRPRADTHSE